MKIKTLTPIYNPEKKSNGDVFNFLVSSVSKMTDITTCTIILFNDHESFIVASTDNAIPRIGPLFSEIESDADKINTPKNQASHSVKKFELKFCASFPIIDASRSTLGCLHIFDDRERTHNAMDIEMVEEAAKDIYRLIGSKSQEHQSHKEALNLENAV